MPRLEIARDTAPPIRRYVCYLVTVSVSSMRPVNNDTVSGRSICDDVPHLYLGQCRISVRGLPWPRPLLYVAQIGRIAVSCVARPFKLRIKTSVTFGNGDSRAGLTNRHVPREKN